MGPTEGGRPDSGSRVSSVAMRSPRGGGEPDAVTGTPAPGVPDQVLEVPGNEGDHRLPAREEGDEAPLDAVVAAGQKPPREHGRQDGNGPRARQVGGQAHGEWPGHVAEREVAGGERHSAVPVGDGDGLAPVEDECVLPGVIAPLVLGAPERLQRRAGERGDPHGPEVQQAQFRLGVRRVGRAHL